MTVWHAAIKLHNLLCVRVDECEDPVRAELMRFPFSLATPGHHSVFAAVSTKVTLNHGQNEKGTQCLAEKPGSSSL